MMPGVGSLVVFLRYENETQVFVIPFNILSVIIRMTPYLNIFFYISTVYRSWKIDIT